MNTGYAFASICLSFLNPCMYISFLPYLPRLPQVPRPPFPRLFILENPPLISLSPSAPIVHIPNHHTNNHQRNHTHPHTIPNTYIHFITKTIRSSIQEWFDLNHTYQTKPACARRSQAGTAPNELQGNKQAKQARQQKKILQIHLNQ